MAIDLQPEFMREGTQSFDCMLRFHGAYDITRNIVMSTNRQCSHISPIATNRKLLDFKLT
jgi:hypothetical protein